MNKKAKNMCVPGACETCGAKNEPKIIEIKDPEENIIKIACRSVLISSSARERPDEHKTAVLRIFTINNPHKNHDVFPTHIFRFTNIEKVRIRRLNVSNYLEGPDIVVNDLEELYIIREGSKLTLKGYQIEVEIRDRKK
ncbi:hypothetical protein JXB28_01590 [Candidatus Woesearchaeota archaeon]|nr:hypothetical protein [Candidatus Woesearchaeota archaeon]